MIAVEMRPRAVAIRWLLASLLALLTGCLGGCGGGSAGSSIPAAITVPVLTGLTRAAAATAITDAGLTVGTVSTQSSSTVASGSVISESPAAGTSVASGTAVSLVVSTGPALVAVPNLVGQTQTAAIAAITAAGLSVGTVTTQSSGIVAVGNVISQSPAAGSAVAGGFAVNLVVSNPCQPAGPPSITIDTPAAGASQLSGVACNVDISKIKVVIYVLTNQWYVQPFAAAPFTNISPSGAWTSFTHPWNQIVVLLVDPASYVPAATKITNPALDAGVLASAQYPATGPTSLQFSGRTWGIKVSADPFDPGPNYWSNDASVVNVAADGLHLKIAKIAGRWQCAEVYLLEKLGYGTYTVQVASSVDRLDKSTVAAPMFIYAAVNQELDFEYSGAGGLIPGPNNAQFVVQPYAVAGNIARYVQPPSAQFTVQMEWRADRVTFKSWNGWSPAPAASDMIQQWAYSGSYIPPPGQEQVHINLWLLGGNAPLSGTGDEMVIRSFAFQP